MNSNTTIGGVIFMLLCIILFVLINRNKRNKEKQFLLLLYGLAEKDNCKISRYDIWNNSVIGIDDLAGYVFAIKNIYESETFMSINLAEIQSCRVNEISRTVSLNKYNVKVFERIDLVFINKDKNKSDLILEFYNTNTGNLDLTGELQMAEKWCKIANYNIIALSKAK